MRPTSLKSIFWTLSTQNAQTFRRGRRGPPKRGRSPPRSSPPRSRDPPPERAPSRRGPERSWLISAPCERISERDLVRVERARLLLVARRRHRAAAHTALTVAAAAEELEVVAADVEAGLLDVVLVRVRARAEAAVDVDLLALLDDLLRGLGLLAPAAHPIPVGLLGPLATAVGDAVHRDREVADRAALRRHAHLGVTPDVADDRDLGHRC